MGNQLGQTIQSRQFVDQSLKDFEYQTVFVEEFDDKCFGPIRVHKRRNVLQNSNNVFIMEKASYNDQKVEFASLYAESQARLELKHKNLLQFLGYDFINQKDFCTTSLRSRLFYEYYYHDLATEISRRADCSEYFNEDELWYILDSLVQVCSFLQENQLYHGDLRPQGIKLTQDGFIKIGDHGLINPMKNGFYKTLVRAENGFLSPEQLQYLMLGLTETKYNVFKSEVFTLGLTMLQCSTLREVSSVYDWDKMFVRTDSLKSLIDFASQFYSAEYIAVLNLMLQFEDIYRPDFIQLMQYVQKENSTRPGKLVTYNPIQQSQVVTPQLLSQPTNLISPNSVVIQPPPMNSTIIPNSNVYNGGIQAPVFQSQYQPQLQSTIQVAPQPLQHTIYSSPQPLQQTIIPQQSMIVHQPVQNLLSSQVVVQRPLMQAAQYQTLPMQQVVQSQLPILNQHTINHQQRVMSNNTYVTNQVQQPQNVLFQKQETFGSYEGNETYKKSVKFNENTDILTHDHYRYQGSHQNSDYSNLKRSQIQFNTDLDRRVTEALEMTRQTIKKNQTVPNIFSEDSPIKQYDNNI